VASRRLLCALLHYHVCLVNGCCIIRCSCAAAVTATNGTRTHCRRRRRRGFACVIACTATRIDTLISA